MTRSQLNALDGILTPKLQTMIHFFEIVARDKVILGARSGRKCMQFYIPLLIKKYKDTHSNVDYCEEEELDLLARGFVSKLREMFPDCDIAEHKEAALCVTVGWSPKMENNK
jgi:hypothetical protein